MLRPAETSLNVAALKKETFDFYIKTVQLFDEFQNLLSSTTVEIHYSCLIVPSHLFWYSFAWITKQRGFCIDNVSTGIHSFTRVDLKTGLDVSHAEIEH